MHGYSYFVLAIYFNYVIRSAEAVVLTLAMRQSILVGVVTESCIYIICKMFYKIKPAKIEL